MENTGTVTIGVDYFATLIEDNAVMKEQIDALERFLAKEDSKLVYIKDIAAIFGFCLDKGPKIWAHVEKGGGDDN